MKGFKPTKAMQVAKAKLWAKLERNPMIGDPAALPQHRLATLMGRKDIQSWLACDGFSEWLFDSSHNQELIQSGVEAAISTMIDLLGIPTTNDRESPTWSDKLKACKQILDAAGFQPKKQDEDKDLADLDEDMLDKLIKKSIDSQNLTPQ